MSAHIIAIAHHAGGVGKTTTALSLGYALAAAGKAVLLVDTDPQADLSIRLQVAPTAPRLADVLIAGQSTPGRERLAWDGVRLDVVPSDLESMAGVDMALFPLQRREERLAWALAGLRNEYAYILVDCPPSISPLSTAALYAADSLIIPVQAQDKAVRQLGPLLDTLAIVRRYRQPPGLPAVLGYLLTMVDSRTLQGREAVADLRAEYGAAVFTATIPDRTAIQHDSRFQAPIGVYSPTDSSAAAYSALAQEVIARATP